MQARASPHSRSRRLSKFRDEPPVDTTVLLRRLEAVADPTPEEREILSSLPGTIREYSAHDDIVRVGDRPSAVCLMLEGMTCRYKLSPDGKRQIMSFHIRGD